MFQRASEKLSKDFQRNIFQRRSLMAIWKNSDTLSYILEATIESENYLASH